MNLLNFIIETWRGKDSYRLFMNEMCREAAVVGKTLDVGSSTANASYYRFLKRQPGAVVECLDLSFSKNSNIGKQIDLEKDSLPYGQADIDTVLLFNVLEHIYNYRQVLGEIKRVLKPGGVMVGAVPFLVNYHPDPQDYWRFTETSLKKVFADELGFSKVIITPFGQGPFLAAWSQLEQTLPKIAKMFLLPIVLGMDKIILLVRKGFNKKKFPLGYFFQVTR